MKYNPQIHHRRSIRLKGYDYSNPGAYFVTICAQHRECLFGTIQNSLMLLNKFGHVLTTWWDHLSVHFETIETDYFVVMPNHLHGIIILCPDKGMTSISQSTKNTLGQVVAYFKYQTTKSINQERATPGQKVWQRNYYEHIIRNETSLEHLRNYIVNNPKQWAIDQLHPQNPSKW